MVNSIVRWVLNLTLCLVFMSSCSTQTIENARDLTTDLITNYSKILKPRRDQTKPVQVIIGAMLLSILEFDEVQEKLSIMAVANIYWEDESMVWTPSNYGGLTFVYFESHQVWTPLLVLINTVNNIKKLGYDDDWLTVGYNNNGSASFYPGGVLSAKCDVDVTYFPWDKHKCCFSFSTWGSGPDAMEISTTTDPISLMYYSPNGAWDLISTAMEPVIENALFNMCITLARKPRFVVVNVIIPIVMMALISSIVFYIPIDCGERVSFSITMLLAIAVFLTLVGDNLPKTSSPMSIYSYYLLSMLLLNIIITIANIFSVKCFYINDKQPVGSCWKSVVRCFKCKERGNRQKIYNENKNGNTIAERTTVNPRTHSMVKPKLAATHNSAIPYVQFNGRRHYQDMHVHMKDWVFKSTKYNNTNTNIDEDIPVTWQDVSIMLDKMFLIVSIILILVITLVFFLIIWIGGTSSD